MQSKSLIEAAKLPVDFAAHQMFADSQTEIIHIVLNAGEEIPLHENQVNVIFYVLEGKGLLTYETQEIVASKDTCIFIEKNKLRSWKNELEQSLNLLVIKQLK